MKSSTLSSLEFGYLDIAMTTVLLTLQNHAGQLQLCEV